jgi:uncharacterized membrane protein
MARRMAIALLSLVAGLSAAYLHLYKLGIVGHLSCTSGGCERAMFSRWGWFLGVDVALVGVIGYTLLLASSLASLQPGWLGARWPTLILAVLGFLFTLRLKYAEFAILRTFCPWCAISAVAITTITVLALLDCRGPRSSPAGEDGSALGRGTGPG